MNNATTTPEAAAGVPVPIDAVVRRVWFTMVSHPANGWIRAGKAYGSREAAREWVPFVRGAWRGLRVKVSQCTLRWVNGQLDERSRRTLDKKFNMDAPNPANLARESASVDQHSVVLPKMTEPEIVELLKRHGIAVVLGAQYSVRCQFGQIANVIREVEQKGTQQ